MIQEALLSPGCTLEVYTTPIRLLSSLALPHGAVTVSRSQELPERRSGRSEEDKSEGMSGGKVVSGRETGSDNVYKVRHLRTC
jgi:hypothetical protein